MQRETKIILEIVGVAIILIIGLLIVNRGTIQVNITPGPATVIIDQVPYKNINQHNFSVSAGQHTIYVTKDGYKAYTTTLDITLQQTKSLNINLGVSDASLISSYSENVANAWITYSQNKNEEELLANIKSYVSNNVYNFTIQDFNGAKSPSRPDLAVQIPLVKGPISKINVQNVDNNSGKANVSVTYPNDNSYLKSFDFDFGKINNKWTITNISYNY